MAAVLATYAPAPGAPALGSAERLRGAMLWLTGFAGAFVLVEPSPYEAVGLAAMVVFALTGLTLRPALAPLIVLLLLLVTALLQQRRAPGSTIAWFLLIIAVPYLAIPAFLLFGGRKIRRLAASKAQAEKGASAPATRA